MLLLAGFKHNLYCFWWGLAWTLVFVDFNKWVKVDKNIYRFERISINALLKKLLLMCCARKYYQEKKNEAKGI